MKNIEILTCSAAIVWASLLTGPSLSVQQACVEITDPSQGATVGTFVLVEGKAIPQESAYLWILVRPRGTTQWYPQGDGEAEIEGGTWVRRVQLGREGTDYGKHEIIAVWTDETGHRAQLAYFKSTRTGNYVPIPLPGSVEGCQPAKIIVDKTD